MKTKKQAEENETQTAVQENTVTADEAEKDSSKKEQKKEKPKKDKQKKESAKKAEKDSKKTVEPAFYIQYDGKEAAGNEIAEKVKELWKEEGHRISSIKSMDLYVKPQEHAVYYVVNEKFKGHIEF